MKCTGFLRMLGLAVLLFMGYGTVSAQAPSALAEKQELQQMTGANYDVWKASVSSQEVEPNKLISTAISNGEKTLLVRLGWDLINLDAENGYETKLAAQPGVLAVDADYQTNTVEITVKEEDEHNALQSYFDIQ